MGISHMVVSATASSLLLQTADPAFIMIGAIAGLGPDIDLSISPAGRVFPWISRWLERRFPHRSCTHSFVASGAVAIATYPAAIYAGLPLGLVHAVNIGYFAGWFADLFTKSGVEMFYPSSVRWVVPANRNFRLATGSSAEYGILVVLVAIALFSFNINANGGVLTQFNRLIASTNGVEQLYNEKGSSHLVLAHIKGVRVSDQSRVQGDFWIVQTYGQGFIVISNNGEIYKVGTEPDCQIKPERITADPGPAATSSVESLRLEEEQLQAKLQQFNRLNALAFVSGKITIDDPESLQLTINPNQFPILRASGGIVTLEAAPLNTVQQALGEQVATGHLFIKSIYVQPKTSSSFSSESEQQAALFPKWSSENGNNAG